MPTIYEVPVYSHSMDKMVSEIIKNNKVKYIFEKDDTYEQDFPCGEYIIMIPKGFNDVDTSYIEEYKQVILNNESYKHTIDYYKDKISELENNDKSFEYIDNRFHEQIEKEFNKRLDNKRLEWSKDIINSYKKEFDSYINERVFNEKYIFLERFYKEEITYDELCSLYKAVIDSEIYYRLENIPELITNKMVNGLSNRFCLYDIDKNKLSSEIRNLFEEEIDKINNIYDSINDYEIRKNINKFKNEIVDRILKMWNIKQGTRDYHIAFRGAGRLADILESYLWQFYNIGLTTKENKK